MTFREYLVQKAGIPEKYSVYYEYWITLYHRFVLENPENENIAAFEKSLVSKYQDWQINQAVDSVNTINFFPA